MFVFNEPTAQNWRLAVKRRKNRQARRHARATRQRIARMEALGGHVFRRNRIEIEDAYYEKQIAADREELAALEAELTKASADRKARLEARIEDTRHKLQDKRDELKARIESVKREGEAKIESLQQQMKTARDERKQRLEKRLAEI